MAGNVGGWAFGLLLVVIGLLNIVLVHPVPGVAYLLLSLVYLPPANTILKEKTGITIPLVLRIILGFVIIWFTLGISDLGDMII
jgi:hypothetical protein